MALDIVSAAVADSGTADSVQAVGLTGGSPDVGPIEARGGGDYAALGADIYTPTPAQVHGEQYPASLAYDSSGVRLGYGGDSAVQADAAVGQGASASAAVGAAQTGVVSAGAGVAVEATAAAANVAAATAVATR